MFNIYINDIFLFAYNACLSNYADETTLYSIEVNRSNNRNILNKNLLLYKNDFMTTTVLKPRQVLLYEIRF